MKTKLLILFFLVSVSLILAQENPYPHVSIRDIQYVPDSLLEVGQDASLNIGDTVQVTGVVMVQPIVDPSLDRRPIMWAGARWQTYLRDTSYNSTEWAGLNVIQNDTSLAVQGTFMDLLDTGMVVTLTGVIAEFVPQTQINVLTNPVYPIQFVGSKPNRGEPVEITIADLQTGAESNLLSGEKYEGMYVIIRNVLTSDRTTSTSASTPFAIYDDNGNKIFIHDQSGYFTMRTHKLREWSPPIDGTTIQYIRGVIGQYNNPKRYVFRPMYIDDMVIGQSPPAISTVRRDSALVLPNQAVKITARILDIDQGGFVTSAKIKYRVNGGERLEAVMTANADTTWTGTIPGVDLDSALVDYYIWAQDNDGMISTNPSDTVRSNYFYLVLNRPLTIQDVQYSPFGSGFGAFTNYTVTVSGIVTADTSDIMPFVFIQNGTGPWSAIRLSGTEVQSRQRGDEITVTGLVQEDFSFTIISGLNSSESVVTNSTGNPLPAPELLSTSVIATKGNGNLDAEPWESVLIKYSTVTVTDDNADGVTGPGGGGNSNFGEILVADLSGQSTRVELQDGNHIYHNFWSAGMDTMTNLIQVKEGDTFDELIGVLYFSFSNYKLIPRNNDDFIGYAVSVDENSNAVVNSYDLSQNYPNPFNPATKINYSIPEAGFVKIKIFNILGQEVKTLVNMEQPAGNYSVNFNATSLPSGVYLYQISVNNYQQTKKMILMK